MHPDCIRHEAITIDTFDTDSPYVIVCEHASSFIPGEYHNLGLEDEIVQSHIGWDINAIHVARKVARTLRGALVTAPVSRLLTDLNRPEACPDCVPVQSETIRIPGNIGLAAQERENRLGRWHRPFHHHLSQFLEGRIQKGLPTFLIGIHSFTPVYDGVSRPWAAGVLYRDARSAAEYVADFMAGRGGKQVGLNQPYDLWCHSNHTIPFHGDRRRIPAIIIEIRNDLLSTETAMIEWADIISQSLQYGWRHYATRKLTGCTR